MEHLAQGREDTHAYFRRDQKEAREQAALAASTRPAYFRTEAVLSMVAVSLVLLVTYV